MRIDFRYSYWDYDLGKTESSIVYITTDNYQISAFSEVNLTYFKLSTYGSWYLFSSHIS